MSIQNPQPQYYASPESTNQYGAVPPLPPKRPSKFKRFLLPIGLLALGLVIGGLVGASRVPEPVVQVQEKIVEKKVNVPTTPASCLTAIQHAESIFGVAAEMSSIMSDAIRAASRFDTAGLNAATAQVKEQNALLDGYLPKWQTSRDACQASR